MKKLKKLEINWEISHVHGLEDNVKMLVFRKFLYKFISIPIKISDSYFVDIQKWV